MPGAPSIDPIRAAQVDVMVGMGYGGNEVARITGVSRSSVRDILNRVGHWGDFAERPIFAKLRAEQSMALEAAGRTLAAKAMAQCEETLPKANAYQSCLIASIMIDKSRLLAGESTENISIHAKHELVNLDQLSALLNDALLESNAGSQGQTTKP